MLCTMTIKTCISIPLGGGGFVHNEHNSGATNRELFLEFDSKIHPIAAVIIV